MAWSWISIDVVNTRVPRRPLIHFFFPFFSPVSLFSFFLFFFFFVPLLSLLSSLFRFFPLFFWGVSHCSVLFSRAHAGSCGFLVTRRAWHDAWLLLATMAELENFRKRHTLDENYAQIYLSKVYRRLSAMDLYTRAIYLWKCEVNQLCFQHLL